MAKKKVYKKDPIEVIDDFLHYNTFTQNKSHHGLTKKEKEQLIKAQEKANIESRILCTVRAIILGEEGSLTSIHYHNVLMRIGKEKKDYLEKYSPSRK